MSESENKWTKAEIKEKLDKNSLDIKINTGLMAFLAACGFASNTVLTLCGFTPGETQIGSAIVYGVAVLAVPYFIRNTIRFVKQRKGLNQELENIDLPAHEGLEQDDSKGMRL